MTTKVGNPGTTITTAQIDTLLSDLGTASRDLTTKLNSLSWVNLGTAGAPIYELQANVIPRTDILANLLTLKTGGGEIASATDQDAIVQLRGPAGTGTATAYYPVPTGLINNFTFNAGTIYRKPDLTGPTSISGPVFAITAASGTKGGGGISIVGGMATTIFEAEQNPGGEVQLIGGDHPKNISGASGGPITISGGSGFGFPGVYGTGVVSITAGSSSFVGGQGGDLYLSAGNASAATGGTGGSTYIGGGAGSASSGDLILLDGAGTPIITISSASKIGFFGTTAVAKPVVAGSKTSGAALTSLLTALATLGLITNSTTA